MANFRHVTQLLPKETSRSIACHTKKPTPDEMAINYLQIQHVTLLGVFLGRYAHKFRVTSKLIPNLSASYSLTTTDAFLLRSL